MGPYSYCPKFLAYSKLNDIESVSLVVLKPELVESVSCDVMPNDNYAKSNDIVLIVKGSTGKVGIVPSSVPEPGKGGWVIGQSAIILRVVSDLIDPHSLFTYLRSNLGQSLLKSITSGSTIPFIKFSDLKELRIIIPDAKMKGKISEILNREDNISKQINELKIEQLALIDNIWNEEGSK